MMSHDTISFAIDFMQRMAAGGFEQIKQNIPPEKIYIIFFCTNWQSWVELKFLKVSSPNIIVCTCWYILHNDRYPDKVKNTSSLHIYAVS